MNLRKDVQVVPFLIRNKIPFTRFAKWITVDETRVEKYLIGMLESYELREYEKPVAERRPKGTGRKPYVRKPKVIKELNYDPERLSAFFKSQTKESVINRPLAKYSNPNFNI